MDNSEAMRDPKVTPPLPSLPPEGLSHRPEEEQEAEAEPSLGQWLTHNAPFLLVVVGIFAYLYFNSGLEGIWTGFKVAIGLSVVIFLHEMGHFLVAKWCDVHVTVFSIGFGPAIPGCKFQWGETTYKLAWVPFGGYVQMVGQIDADESSDGSEDDPRSYRNKTVGQRMAIISAGVVMNLILAVVCFVIVFQGPGKDRGACVVGGVDAISPAFKKGLRTGALILQIGDVKHPYFENLMATVLASRHGENLDITLKRPQDKEAVSLEIEPMLSTVDPRPMLGISSSVRAQLASRRDLPDPGFHNPVFPHSVAGQASPPLEFGDRLIATSDPDHPEKMLDLPLDPRKPNSNQRDYFELDRRFQLLAGKKIRLQVERGVEKKKKFDIEVPPAFHYTFGARMQMGQITALRDGSPAEEKVHARNKEKNLEGDVILQVEVIEADGKKHQWGDKDRANNPIDPLRLPFELRQWADGVTRVNSKQLRDYRKVILWVLRHKGQAGEQYQQVRLELPWNQDWRFDRVLSLSPSSPLAIPELGLSYQVKTTVAHVNGDQADSPGGLRKFDVIKKVRFYQLEPGSEEKKPGKWVELDAEEFAWVFYLFQFPGTAQAKYMTVEVERGKEKKEIEIEARKDLSWPLSERGLIFAKDVRRQKAGNFFEAVAIGLKDTHDNMMQVYQNLRGMLTGRISIKNLGGPVTIARVAYRIAGYDFWEFLFFIGLISVNLAVINFLPIPVLDGGHMVFLIYEKIRGKPASEGVRVGATYAGLALILSLMAFVLYLDFTRMFPG